MAWVAVVVRGRGLQRVGSSPCFAGWGVMGSFAFCLRGGAQCCHTTEKLGVASVVFTVGARRAFAGSDMLLGSGDCTRWSLSLSCCFSLCCWLASCSSCDAARAVGRQLLRPSRRVATVTEFSGGGGAVRSPRSSEIVQRGLGRCPAAGHGPGDIFGRWGGACPASDISLQCAGDGQTLRWLRTELAGGGRWGWGAGIDMGSALRSIVVGVM